MSEHETIEADVAVVGAGLAGLWAAALVAREGRSVVVVEARDRVGGRTLTTRFGRGDFDLGAQFIGPTHHRLERLAGELGVAIHPTPTGGRRVLERNGRVTTYEGTVPRLGPLALLDLHLTIRRIDRLALDVPLDDPAGAARAAEWDRQSLEAWKQRRVWTDGARGMLDVAVRAVFGAEPAELSLLYFLFYVRSGGGLVSLADDAQRGAFAGGSQQLSARLAERLGDRVVTGSPVRAILQEEDAVTVVSDRSRVRARRCVVALPPALAGRIAYEPAMPASRDRLTQRMPMGATVKCVATYERPFWRERGLSGEAVSVDGPVTATFDDTSGDEPALLGFVVGREARGWDAEPLERRQARVVDALTRLFGTEASRPTGYLDMDWAAEEWTRGCPVGLMGADAVVPYASKLREPVGRIHWAGTETAMEWNGYMEGALESAERVVAEVLKNGHG